MAILFMDGFDCYASTAQAYDAGWYPESDCTISTTGGRFGGGALAIAATLSQWIRSFPNVAYGSVVYVAFSYIHHGFATTNLMRLRSEQAASIMLLSHDAAGTITFTPNSGSSTTEAGTSLVVGSWNRIEVKVTLGTTASNGACEVRVNGTTVINVTGVDTNTTGIGASVLELGAGGAASTNTAYIDDVIIFDTTGSGVTDFLGDVKITTQSPNADAATVDWTASAGSDYQCVDETPNAANDDTDYISSSTAAQESRFAMSNLAASPASVHAVQVRYRAKKTDAGNRTIRSLINSNSNEDLGTERGLSTAYRWYHGDVFELDPDGSVAWDEASINALEVGVEVVT